MAYKIACLHFVSNYNTFVILQLHKSKIYAYICVELNMFSIRHLENNRPAVEAI